MRRMSDVDWTEIFERVSVIDAVLADGCDFAEMDFPTRNLYRTAVEELARGSGLSELEIARRAVAAAAAANRSAAASGSRLLSLTPAGARVRGRHRISPALSRVIRPVLSRARHRRLYRRGRDRRRAAAGDADHRPSRGQPDWIWLGLLGTLGASPALDAAVALVNQGLTHRFGVDALPGLELRDGVPKHLRTLVVVPTLLTTREAVAAQIERLEIHHLASSRGDVQFALLSDWTDAASETVEGDEALLRTAIEGDRAPEPASRAGARRRPVPTAPSPARMEREPTLMDRLGAQARQAA